MADNETSSARNKCLWMNAAHKHTCNGTFSYAGLSFFCIIMTPPSSGAVWYITLQDNMDEAANKVCVLQTNKKKRKYYMSFYAQDKSIKY